MRCKTIKYVLLFWMISVPALWTQSITCSASTSKQVLTVGEPFTLTVEITGTTLGDVRAPKLPDIPGIEPVQGIPGESSSIEIINGRRRESRSFQYALRAVREGHWTIPPLSLIYQGKTHQTRIIAIEVMMPGKQAAQAVSASADFILRAVISKPDPFVGEQVTVRFKIYTRGNISNYTPIRNPNFIGFWAEDYPIYQPITPERESINGKLYSVFTVKHTALFPTYSGALVVDAAEIECEVQIPSERNLFNNFFSPFKDPFGETAVKRLRSEPVIIQVKPLPVKGQPDTFNGLVGQFDAFTQVSKINLRAGELVSYIIEIRGSGNIMNVDIPATPFGDAFVKYEPKTSFDINRDNYIISGKVRIEYLAVPKEAGEYVIEGFTFSFFDPVTQKYLTRFTEPVKMSVKPAETGSAAANDKKDYSRFVHEIRPIKTDSGALHISHWRIPVWLTALLWLMPPAGLVAAYLYRRHRLYTQTPGSMYVYQHALQKAIKKINQTAPHLPDNQDASSRALSIFTDYLIEKNIISQAGERLLYLADRLRGRGYTEKVIAQAERFIADCNESRFSPASEHDSRTLLEHCRALLHNINEEKP